MRPFIMFRGLICQMDKYYKKQNSYLLSSLLDFTNCDFTNISFHHSQISIFVDFREVRQVSWVSYMTDFPIFQPSIKTSPTYAIWSTIPTTNNGSSELGRPGYMGFYICYGYERLCFEFPIKAKVLALQLQNINPCTSNSHPIPHYWWRRKHPYYNQLLYGC